MKKLICLAFVVAVGLPVLAQKPELTSGNLADLKHLKSVGVEVTYEKLLVGAEIAEADFIAARKNNWDTKEPGKGDEWEQYWHKSKGLYEPAFANNFLINSGVSVNPKSPFKMILKVFQIEPGWNGGPMGGPAFILSELWIVDSANPEKIIAVLKLPRYKGNDKTGGDFEMGRRIEQAFATAGKQIGLYFKAKVI